MNIPGKGRQICYFDQDALMTIGRKMIEAIQVLSDMSNEQDEKRNALMKKRKNRLGKKGKFMNIRNKGKGGIQLSSKADNTSEAGLTDTENMSDSSSSFLDGARQLSYGTKIDGKMSMKNFINMMKHDKMCQENKSQRSNSR